jgi:hypothetical protein
MNVYLLVRYVATLCLLLGQGLGRELLDFGQLDLQQLAVRGRTHGPETRRCLVPVAGT